MWSIACMAKLKVMNSTIGFRPAEGRADAEAGEAVLGDRRVDHPLGAELLQQALADLVGALVLGDLLAHQEDLFVARISSAMASRRASRTVIVDGLAGPFGLGGGAGGDGARPAPLAAGAALAGAASGRLPRARRGAARIQRAGVLAVLQQHRDRRVDRHAFGALRRSGSCRSRLRRRPRPPWSPCRSRSRRSRRRR